MLRTNPENSGFFYFSRERGKKWIGIALERVRMCGREWEIKCKRLYTHWEETKRKKKNTLNLLSMHFLFLPCILCSLFSHSFLTSIHSSIHLSYLRCEKLIAVSQKCIWWLLECIGTAFSITADTQRSYAHAHKLEEWSEGAYQVEKQFTDLTPLEIHFCILICRSIA